MIFPLLNEWDYSTSRVRAENGILRGKECRERLKCLNYDLAPATFSLRFIFIGTGFSFLWQNVFIIILKITWRFV
jgi:hypothetical protein